MDCGNGRNYVILMMALRGKEPGDITGSLWSGDSNRKVYLFMNAVSAYVTSLLLVASDRFGKAAKGATAVEYGLLVALIAAVIIAAVTAFGQEVRDVFAQVQTAMQGRSR